MGPFKTFAGGLRGRLTDLWPFFTSGYIVAYVFARWHYHPDDSGDLPEEK